MSKPKPCFRRSGLPAKKVHTFLPDVTQGVEHPQLVLTRDQLVEHIAFRSPDMYDRSLDAQISRLRAKLRDNARNPEIILTMRGDGYMLALAVTRERGEDA